MVEIARQKEEVVSALADATDKLQQLQDHLMSSAFRLTGASAKEEMLASVSEAISLFRPGVEKLAEIVDAIES